MAQITIFHTSDIHNKLTSEIAAKLRNLKIAYPGSLMLDSGDAIWAGNIYWRPGGEPVFDLMNFIPYDALCMGNREFHFLSMGVKCKTKKANFPILSANLRPKKPGIAMYSQPYIEIERNGLRIIVLGLSVPCITEKMLVRKISDYYFDQPIAAAQDIVPDLRHKCDILIALTHIGIAKDRELAKCVNGIDIILGGHTHIAMHQPEKVGNTYILHHGCFAKHFGKIEVSIDSNNVSLTSELLPLSGA